jgi:hypothetical protein
MCSFANPMPPNPLAHPLHSSAKDEAPDNQTECKGIMADNF